jgi:hypothetical protein
MPRLRFRTVAVALTVAVTSLWLVPPAAYGISFFNESWGNEPLPAGGFGDWPNILPVVNHRSRVYGRHTEHGLTAAVEHRLYYRGDADALNAALRAFAKVGGEKRFVVLRPGPAEVYSVNKQKKAPFDWSLHAASAGTNLDGTPRARHGNEWDRWPTITIHVGGGNIELEKIEVPRGVAVLHLGDLIERLREQVKDDNSDSRLSAAVELSGLDPYTASDARTIAGMLDAEHEWQIHQAVGALSRYGVRARFALPKLRSLLNPESQYIRHVIETIESAQDDAEAAKAHREAVQRFEKFVRGLEDAAP